MENDIYKEPLVQHLLDQIPNPVRDVVDWRLTFPIIKKLEDKGKHIIAGYASVEVIDSQNELIPIPVLKESWEQFKANKDFYFGSLMHSNVPVIKILDTYTDSTGQVWKSGVDENGLFIVAEVRQDIEKGKQTWELIQKDKLGGFSIGGEGLATTTVCEGTGKCHTRVDKMELHEIAVVDKPANAPSIFKIVKREVSKDLGVNEEATEETLKGRLNELLEERKSIAEKLVGIVDEKRKKDQVKLDMLYSEIKNIEDVLSRKSDIDKNVLGEKLINKLMESSIEKLDIALKRMIGKPFAGYSNFAECERENSGKKDPAAYCASIMHQVEGKCGCGVGQKVKYIECPVDDTINKAVWERLDTALIKLIS